MKFIFNIQDSKFQTVITLLICVAIISYLNYYLELSKYPKPVAILPANSEFTSDPECLKEWILLNEDTFFRRNLAFYYTDLKLIKLYLERRPLVFSKFNISIKVNVKTKDSKFSKQTVLTSIVHKKIQQHESYSFESIEATFDLNHPINNVELFQVIIIDKKYSSGPIDLVTKRYHNTNKRKTLICSKLYRFFRLDSLRHFEWWIQMNKLNGVDKIVINYNSLPTNWELSSILNLNPDLIQLKNFKCIPNLIENDKKDMNFFRNFDQIRRIYKKYDSLYSDHFDSFVYHECQLENSDKYEYITQNDHEEIILAQYLKQDYLINSKLLLYIY